MTKSRSALKSYWQFVKNHMDLRGLGIVTLGLGLPTLGSMVLNSRAGSTVVSYMDRVPGMNTPYGKAALAVATSAAISFALARYGPLTAGEAMTASMIATGLVGATLLKSLTGNALVQALPGADLNGIGGYGYAVNGYNGYLGYLGEAHGEMDNPEPLQLYGAPAKVNVF